MLTPDEVELVKNEMQVTVEEMPILNALAGLRVDFDEVCDAILIVRAFVKWHERNGYPYNLLKEFKASNAENQWFAIQCWWDEYCDVRKKINEPRYEDLFVRLRNYKPDRLRKYGPDP